MKKLILSIIIFTISTLPLFLYYSESSLQMIDIELIWVAWQSDVLFWNIINSWNENKLIKVSDNLVINLHPDSSFILNNMNSWELLKWSMTIDSLFDFDIKSLSSSAHLSRSSLYIKNLWDKTRYVSFTWISNIEYGKLLIGLSNNYWISIDETNESSDVFSLLKSSSYKNIPIKDQKSINLSYQWNMFIRDLFSNSIESLLFFDKKKDKIKYNEKIQKYETCSDYIKNLNLIDGYYEESSKNYATIKKLCFLSGIVSDNIIFEAVKRDVLVIKDLKSRYSVAEMLMKTKKRSFKMEIEDNIQYLNESLENANMSFASALIEKLKKQIETERNIPLDRLIRAYVSIDAIAHMNTFIVDKNFMQIRWNLEDKILGLAWESKVDFSSALSDFHFHFSKTLLSKQRYDIIDYTLERRVFFDIEKGSSQIAKIYNDFIDKTKILHQAYVVYKREWHWAAEEQDAIEIASEQQIKEDKIKKLIKSFDKIEKRTTNTFNYDLIKNKFSRYNLSINKEDIIAHIKSWNTFSIKNIRFANFTLELDYDYKNNTVFNTKIYYKDRCDEIIWSINLSKLSMAIALKTKPRLINTKVASIFTNTKEKEFSYEEFLEKELVKKYLESLDIYADPADMIKIDENVFMVNRAYIEYQDGINVDFSFVVALTSWEVAELKLLWSESQQIFAEANYAKNLPWIIKRTHEIMNIRNKNDKKATLALAEFGIMPTDLSIDSLARDWFIVKSSWDSKVWKWKIDWIYFAEKELFSSIEYSINDIIEIWTWINLFKLKENISEIAIMETERINKEEEDKKELIKRFIDYMNVPDELINWDWIWNN